MSAGVETLRADAQHTANTQKRTVGVLISAQILGAMGVGAALTVGTGLIIDVSGNETISGFAATMNTLGAAAAGIPLARLAVRKGRRYSLATGNLIAVLGAAVIISGAYTALLALVLVGLMLMGVGAAVQLQARFAATDMASPKHQARDLSLVVFSTTIGAVLGPNLVGPGDRLSDALNMPELTGTFLITGSAQILATLIVLVFLRPDPLLTAQRVQAEKLADDLAQHVPQPDATEAAEIAHHQLFEQRAAIAVIAIAQAVMVGLMAMTPVNLAHHGYGIEVVGLTISLHIAGMYALSPVFGVLADKFGAKRTIVFGIAQLLGATFFTFIAGDNSTFILIGLILLGTGWSAVTVAGAAQLTASTPLGIRPKRQGQSDALMNLAGATAGAIAGLGFATGGFPMLSVIGALLSMVILAIILVVFVRKRAALNR